jgi:hypothetical protein
MTRIDPVTPLKQATEKKTSQDATHLHTQKKRSKKALTPEDGVKILHHLFKNKIQDSAMRCRYKKAKKRYFIACTNGNIIKDNFWEFSASKTRLKLIARSQSALFIIKRYKFKELKQDNMKASKKIEKALIAFFKRS